MTFLQSWEKEADQQKMVSRQDDDDECKPQASAAIRAFEEKGEAGAIATLVPKDTNKGEPRAKSQASYDDGYGARQHWAHLAESWAAGPGDSVESRWNMAQR